MLVIPGCSKELFHFQIPSETFKNFKREIYDRKLVELAHFLYSFYPIENLLNWMGPLTT